MWVRQISPFSFFLEFESGSIVMDPVDLCSADIKIYSVKNSPYLNYNSSENTLIIQNAGEYEVKDIFINSRKNKGLESFVYNISSEGIKLGFISFVNKLSAIPFDLFKNTDILVVGAGGGPLLTPKDVSDLLNKLSPSIAVVFGFKEQSKNEIQNDLVSFEDVKKEISGLAFLDKQLKLEKDEVKAIESTVYYAFNI